MSNEILPNCNHVSVCICTYKRPGLLTNLLEKLRQQHTDGAFRYSAVIVDNDVNQSGKTVVETFKQKSSFTIDYFVEPEQNISLARNKAVKNAKGNFIALIDDDEYPGPNWLSDCYKTLINSGANGVLGPVIPDYPPATPKWIVKSKIWEMPYRKTGTRLNWPEARTSNVFLHRSIFEGQEEPFDPRFGLTGGEDQDFFKRMMSSSSRFVWCNEAPVYEVIPSERWGRRFYLKKYLQMGGQTGESAKKWSLSRKCKWSAKALIGISFYSLALPFSCLLGRHMVMRCLVKNCYFFGWISALFWRPILRHRY